MEKNGKFFLEPSADDCDFKSLFQRLAAAGAGRPIDKDGLPSGPWTPELLAEEISSLAPNNGGIDLRTVQLWFQDNDKGISAENRRWLARIFGCGDPEATSEWQVKLHAAQSRLVKGRREKRMVAQAPRETADAGSHVDQLSPEHLVGNVQRRPLHTKICLARRSETLFGGGSPLDLPISVIAGASALGFLSYFFGIHCVTYPLTDGTRKQIGFLWAPNWTLLFMVFMPLFFALVVDLVAYWKDEGRSQISRADSQSKTMDCWIRKVDAASITFWIVFLLCLGFAGLFQWFVVRLFPLLSSSSDYAIDWGTLATVRPEVTSIALSIIFTGLAYLYMCLSFFLFFAGLILLCIIVEDFHDISSVGFNQQDASEKMCLESARQKVLLAVFRCTLLGLLIAICMKLQAFYLSSTDENILVWLLRDTTSLLFESDAVGSGGNFSMPTHYSSLLVALASLIVFTLSWVRLGSGHRLEVSTRRMAVAIVFLVLSYLLFGAFDGSTLPLGIGVMMALYGLYDPTMGALRNHLPRDKQNVL